MGRVARNWFDKLRKKFIKPSHKNITILHSDHLIIEDFHSISAASSTSLSPLRQHLTREDNAATKIQAVFRGHLARRAYVALRSLVKLQALARGAYVRKQARIAMQCMHALVRLQVRVRARQLLKSHTDNQ